MIWLTGLFLFKSEPSSIPAISTKAKAMGKYMDGLSDFMFLLLSR
jgi:hypothetical protein